MLLICQTTELAKSKIPAVVHADGTARLQTVDVKSNPDLYLTLRAFESRTGLPVLINTSFNVAGEAIVETPIDAVECFLFSGLDVLAIENYIIQKSENLDKQIKEKTPEFLERRKKRFRDASLDWRRHIWAGELTPGMCLPYGASAIDASRAYTERDALVRICEERLSLINQLDQELKLRRYDHSKSSSQT